VSEERSTFAVMVRPVGSHCWTVESLAVTRVGAETAAAEWRNRKIRFANGSMHLQSTAIVELKLPGEPDKTQQHYEADTAGTVKRSVA